MNLDALADSVLARCDVLAGCSEEPGRLTRRFLTPPFRQVHDHLSRWMAAAGLHVRLDAAGNLRGRAPAREPDAPLFVVGSHLDTVPDAGKYDGVLGVLLGVAAAEALSGRRFPRALEVIAFSEEEGARFGAPYLGSLAACGRLGADLLARRDAGGVTVAEAIRAYGLDVADLPAAAYPPGAVAGYLEAHIEQGPVLDSLGLPLGVVPAILGQTRAWVRFAGHAGHAGAQPMHLRRDALAAAAALVTAVEHLARTTPGMRATVGSLTVWPGATNVVPGEARLSIDVRHADDAVRARAVAELLAFARAAAGERGVGVEVEPGLEQPAVACDPGLTARLAAALEDRGHRPEPVPSGAGHDAVVMAGLCPVAMLFLRSPGGVSHHPAESVRREDVRAALDVMVRFLEDELAR
jgi:allantoate deiminase